MAKKKPDKNFILHLKIFIKYRYFWLILIIVFMVNIIFYFLNLLPMEKEALFWFFSATSQSMAALFAVVGMFAVYRFQTIETQLIDHRNVLKNKFRDPDWRELFGYLDVENWRYNEVLRKARGQLTIAKTKKNQVRGEIPVSFIIRDLRGRITELSQIEKSKIYLSYHLLIPMAAILITFILSICSLPLSSTFSINFSRYVILLIVIVFIVFSLTSLYRFFKFSMNPKWDRK